MAMVDVHGSSLPADSQAMLVSLVYLVLSLHSSDEPGKL